MKGDLEKILEILRNNNIEMEKDENHRIILREGTPNVNGYRGFWLEIYEDENGNIQLGVWE